MGIIDRAKRAWNVFVNNRDPTYEYRDYGPSYSYRPDRVRFSRGNERTIVTAIYNRIALDVANVDIMHCRLDEDGRYLETIDSKLNRCLNLEANIDQTAKALVQDIVVSMFDEGHVAVVPINTTEDPKLTDSYDIYSMRTGKIKEWYPNDVKISVYNDRTGKREDIIRPKRTVAIIENPFYAVMNEPNSTMQRLIRKLSILDAIDEQSGAGKLDLIIQLPFVVKSEARKEQAEKRRKDVEMQLAGSKYGIAYTDATEKITQLNRSVDNNLMKQIEYLTSMLYGQLSITQEIMDGTANEQTMLNYSNRTVDTIISAIVNEFKRKFLSQTARTQMQSITYFRDPFKLAPLNNIAEIADKLTRNEIMTSNEIRQKIGLKPSKDPKADQLINSNIAQAKEETPNPSEALKEGGESQNGEV